MKVKLLKDAKGNVFTPKVSADSVYLSGSSTTLTNKLSSVDTILDRKADKFTVSSSTPTATWGGTIVVGTVDGTDLKFKMPANPDTHYTAKNVVASSSTGTANVTAATSNPYINLIENGAVRSTHRISGSGATSVNTDTNGNITISSTNTTYNPATQSANGLMSSTDKAKLDGIATGAEVNQNAFSNVKVGDVTVAADSKTDTLTLVAGSNVTITPDATNDKITIASSYVDTTYSAGTDLSLSGTTFNHANSGVSAGTYRSVTVNARGHVTAGTNPTTLSGYGITDAKIASGVITLGSNTITPLTADSTLAAGKVSGTLATSNIPNLDASKITTGTISVDRLPATALERCVVVADDTARFKLTTSSVQVGDTVKVTATKKMYMVIDSSKLSSEAGYEEYFTSTDWSTITNKPSSFTPATHSHAAATQSDNGFMSSADKTKLDGIATGANKYTHPTYTAQSSGLYKITVDGTGHVSAATAVAKADITALGIPSADTTNVSSTTTGSGNAVTSVTASGSTITVTKGATFLTEHQDISGKLDKINVEYNKEIAMGQSGYICIGKFPCYDSNITIYIDSSTSTTYHGVLIIATQNINTSGGGTITAHTYGDVSNTLTPALKLEYNNGSNSVNVYFQPQPWSKNLFHIRCNALAGAPTDIATSVSSIPDTASRTVTNLITSALDGKADSIHNHNYAGSSSVGGPANDFVAELATAASDRYVYFAYDDSTYNNSNASSITKGRAVVDSEFKYNPSTNTLTVGTVKGDLSGNATSSSSIAASSQLTSADAVDGFLEGNKLKYATFTNYSDIGFGSNDGMIVSIPWSSSKYGFQLAFDDTTEGRVKIRGKSETWGSWKQLWKEGDSITAPSVTATNGFTGDLTGTASKSTGDSNGQKITETYIKGLSASDTTITYTKGDGSTGTITTKDTTYSSETAASGGTDVSLVTTGEKYIWNSKADGNHTHNYAGSASVGGSATSSQALDGFSRQTSQTWGVQTGTFVHGEGVDGCDWGFRKDCPVSGAVSLVVDGRFYQNEGQYACIDTSGGTITGNLGVNGTLNAGSVQLNSAVTLQYNSSTESLDFIFA